MLKKLLLLAFVAAAAAPVSAAHYAVKDATGATIFIRSFDTGSSELATAHVLLDSGFALIDPATKPEQQLLRAALGTPFQAGGSIGNTAFGINGPLPAFASPPTVNLGTLNGAATDTTVAGVTTAVGTVKAAVDAVAAKQPTAPALETGNLAGAKADLDALVARAAPNANGRAAAASSAPSALSTEDKASLDAVATALAATNTALATLHADMQAPTPAGTNLIGAFTSPTLLAAINAATPTGTNAIGTVGVTALPALPPGTNAIGTVSAADVTSTGTLTAPGQNVPLSVVNGMSAAAAQVTGTWTGTLGFEGTVDGTNFVPINGTFSASSTPTTATTVNGLIRFTPAGLTAIRLNATALTSGSAVVTMRAGWGTGGTFMNQATVAGTNTIGNVNALGSAGVALQQASTANGLVITGGVGDGVAPVTFSHGVAGVDGGGLKHTILTDTAGRPQVNATSAGTVGAAAGTTVNQDAGRDAAGNLRAFATDATGALVPVQAPAASITETVVAVPATTSTTLVAANPLRLALEIQCDGTATVGISLKGTTLTSVAASPKIMPATVNVLYAPPIASTAPITAYTGTAQTCRVTEYARQ